MQLKDKREEIVNTSLGIQVAAHLGLMLGTIGAIVPAAFNYALNDVGLPLMYANILAAMVGGIAAKAVDGGLKKYLPYTVAWLAGGEDKDTGAERMKVFNWLVLLICLVQLLTTFYMNLAVTPDVVQYATGDADVSDQERRLTSQADCLLKTKRCKWQKTTSRPLRITPPHILPPLRQVRAQRWPVLRLVATAGQRTR
jgi:hypothetical protein